MTKVEISGAGKGLDELPATVTALWNAMMPQGTGTAVSGHSAQASGSRRQVGLNVVLVDRTVV